MEYTYDDIITAKDIQSGKVKKEDIIGKKGWFLVGMPLDMSLNVIVRVARWHGVLQDYDEDMASPFQDVNNHGYAYFLPEKEPEKKYVPFDLSKEEDRARLRGAWIRRKDYPGDEYQIVGISITNNLIFFDDSAYLSTDVILKRCEFVDGSPCGKLVEE